jgi:hypothetical protein
MPGLLVKVLLFSDCFFTVSREDLGVPFFEFLTFISRCRQFLFLLGGEGNNLVNKSWIYNYEMYDPNGQMRTLAT